VEPLEATSSFPGWTSTTFSLVRVPPDTSYSSSRQTNLGSISTCNTTFIAAVSGIYEVRPKNGETIFRIRIRTVCAPLLEFTLTTNVSSEGLMYKSKAPCVTSTITRISTFMYRGCTTKNTVCPGCKGFGFILHSSVKGRKTLQNNFKTVTHHKVMYVYHIYHLLLPVS
jgi:hypothetical protein